jgi:uncharacterized protein
MTRATLEEEISSELIAEFERAAQAIRSNPSLYLLELPNQALVLFRVDGLVIQLKPVVYHLLSAMDQAPLDQAVISYLQQYGDEEVEGALRAIIELGDSAAIMTEPAPLQRPDPKTHEPTGILIMVTQTCNLACTYCYGGGGTYGSPNKLLSEQDALRAVEIMLERAPHKRRFTVTFFGGEPLLNFPLVRRIVEHCTQLGDSRKLQFDYTMTTNGTIVTAEIIAFLKTHRFTLMVSYDGPGQDAHRPFATGGSSDAVVRSNLQRLAEAGIPFQLRATLTKQFAKEETIDQLVQIGRSLGNKKVATSSVSANRNEIFPANEELTLDPEDGSRLQNVYRRLTEQNLQVAQAGSDGRAIVDSSGFIVRALAEGKAVGLGRCGAGLGMVAASTDGNLYPCHRFVGLKEYALGTLESGVDPEKVQSFFEQADAANKEKCQVCFARQICGGFCFYNISDGNGGFMPPDERECDHFRQNVKFALATLLRLQDMPPEAAARYLKSV